MVALYQLELHALRQEAMRVREVKSAVKDQMDDARSSIEVDQASELLKNERCVLQYIP